MGRKRTVLSKEWLAARILVMPSGCWEWQKARINGYGATSIGHKNAPAHRAAWLIYKGAIPPGLWVLHKCDNPPCCNPDHLFLGTPLDNTTDSMRKGRRDHIGPIQQKRMAKITPEQVSFIREQFRSGLSQTKLAAQFNLKPSTISRICTRSNWRNVA